jgi:hypothetical protein
VKAGMGFLNFRYMESFFVTFDGPWFPSEDSVDGLLRRLDMGEEIPISKLKSVCEKEGREFKIVFEK